MQGRPLIVTLYKKLLKEYKVVNDNIISCFEGFDKLIMFNNKDASRFFPEIDGAVEYPKRMNNFTAQDKTVSEDIPALSRVGVFDKKGYRPKSEIERLFKQYWGWQGG